MNECMHACVTETETQFSWVLLVSGLSTEVALLQAEEEAIDQEADIMGLYKALSHLFLPF